MEPTETPNEYDYDKETENDTICDYPMRTVSRPLISVLLMLIFILSLFGNSVVISTVWRVQRKQRAALLYIGNLALADLALTVSLPLWVLYTAMDNHWPFGVALCKIISYMDHLSMYASVFLLTCMSFDRYLAIVHSLSLLCTGSHNHASIAAVWMLSGLLSTPALVFRTTLDDPSSNRTFCMLDFSFVTTSEHQASLLYAGLSLSLSTLGFLLPLLAMVVCYGLIGSTVIRHFNTCRKGDQRKWQLLKVVTTVVVVFAVCWIPHHVVRTVGALSDLNLFPVTCDFWSSLKLAYPYTACLAYINSCLNPFLYAFLDLRFRSRCLHLLQLKKYCQKPTRV
ncbi:apelin receptor B-like [Syngnathus scovelli]|uniref:apelin receptor B-like n=1 Tax=Syngnathus scovelli TaxID=161590 RepID=UPI00210F5039|nr:apelin receptor B-like [Syngnathus scovelli]